MTSDLKLKPSDVLAKAADLIEPEGAWTQRYYARGTGGAMVGASSPVATCRCVIGALWCVTTTQGDGAVYARGLAAFEDYGPPTPFVRLAIGVDDIIEWNDAPERTQAEVVAALRKASSLAREAGE